MTHALLIDDSQPGVRVVTLNRPERMNALDGPTLAALNDAVKTTADPARTIRVIVIRGTGRAFCAGNDLKWLASGVLADPAAHMRHQDLMQDTFAAMEGARQIVIASVNGHAVAGGFELALAADIVIVDERAELGDAHLQRNLLPSGGGSQRLPRKIGLARAMYYLVTGRRMTGRDAERMGLASLAVSGDELDAATLQLAAEIARIDADALAAMKQMTRRGLEMPLNDGLAMERWMQYRYRTESPTLAASVHAFAQRNTG
ncbi:enoyl-CoA hydratase/isomerase family protein [Burkholderia lata]|uniref:Enoyl-CoA hydratase n=1 Tax=Burkholderia lata (strain ATCC 17760 / DSM 23089 / LMG 22485 / NCIMB 9086 / R18194 / 383) TaxID=482957 RepID=A0A6P2TMR2_BURL3|nr:enoyl-CoA hydratase/isomerase family protein [Burkholderia lata]VWC57728.1 enoyl-CoA hydratase [Burkholderia lata]